jgi:hypothetical protein
MNTHDLNIFIDETEPDGNGFHYTTVELSKFNVRYLFYRARITMRMNVRMRPFRAFGYRLDSVRATKGAQVEVQ